MTDAPEIRIKYSWLLDPIQRDAVRYTLKEEWRGPQPQTLVKRASQLEKMWGLESEKLLRAMCKITGMTFYKDIIDVYIVAGLRAISDPMVIGAATPDKRFNDVLTHELLHTLVTENQHSIDVLKIWSKMFPKVKDYETLVHIPIHAIHKYLYLNVLKNEERLRQDISWSEDYPSYRKSWKIVEKRGYKEIIKEFRSYY